MKMLTLPQRLFFVALYIVSTIGLVAYGEFGGLTITWDGLTWEGQLVVLLSGILIGLSALGVELKLHYELGRWPYKPRWFILRCSIMGILWVSLGHGLFFYIGSMIVSQSWSDLLQFLPKLVFAPVFSALLFLLEFGRPVLIGTLVGATSAGLLILATRDE